MDRSHRLAVSLALNAGLVVALVVFGVDNLTEAASLLDELAAENV